MFRGEESSNRIEISWLVQDFWCFGLHVALQRGQVGGEVSGSMGCPHTCAHTHACTCIHVYKLQMAINPRPNPPTHHPLQGGTPGISKNSITVELIEMFQFHLKIWNLWRIPHPWVGEWIDGWGQVKLIKIFNNCWPNQDNSILFEDLWFVETPTHGWVCGWVGCWMGGSMSGVRSND